MVWGQISLENACRQNIIHAFRSIIFCKENISRHFLPKSPLCSPTIRPLSNLNNFLIFWSYKASLVPLEFYEMSYKFTVSLPENHRKLEKNRSQVGSTTLQTATKFYRDSRTLRPHHHQHYSSTPYVTSTQQTLDTRAATRASEGHKPVHLCATLGARRRLQVRLHTPTKSFLSLL